MKGLSKISAQMNFLGLLNATSSPELASGPTPCDKPDGQLNPAHSRWLMGLPPEWDACGVTAMQSLPRQRKRS